jgi:hypothetical protein
MRPAKVNWGPDACEQSTAPPDTQAAAIRAANEKPAACLFAASPALKMFIKLPFLVNRTRERPGCGFSFDHTAGTGASASAF